MNRLWICESKWTAVQVARAKTIYCRCHDRPRLLGPYTKLSSSNRYYNALLN